MTFMISRANEQGVFTGRCKCTSLDNAPPRVPVQPWAARHLYVQNRKEKDR